jgi:hypothetical protein
MIDIATIRFEPQRADDFLLIAEVGDPLSPEGQTRTEVTGMGKLLVTHTTGERDRTASAKPLYGELDREQILVLFTMASQFNWTAKFPPRPGIPDEAIVDWWLRDVQSGELHLRAWLRDVEKNPAMSRAITILRRAVERVSEGSVFL